MVGGSQQGNIFGRSADAMSAGAKRIQNNPYIGAAGDIYDDSTKWRMQHRTMNSYLNPYQSQVIDDLVMRQRQRRSEDLNMLKSEAVEAGAYGDVRRGLVRNDLLDKYAQTEDEAVSRALQEGFTTAATLGQNRINQIQAGASGLLATGAQRNATGEALINAGVTGFGVGGDALNRQFAQGTEIQKLNQLILDQASGQYDTFANWPTTSLNTALSGLAGNPLSAASASTATRGYNPGLLDYASFGAGKMGAGK